MTTHNNIQRNTPVEFDCDDGRLTGTVIDIQRSVENARAFAIIEIDHELPGVVRSVPLDQLRRAA
ncbi:hypothetical protein D3870_09815 [Noviherbaspirillum cavernae]|uniref:DUF2171 domain-containing protein n=1 Tax=Noviherbaspirillum cavernae TaxID=2320862 RepID=A0A418X1E1_9BURK|nr:hypothetical protein [Noviherbaspirillum cavernae]RJG06269.1 hypothetical protein D3870_09815 [Noviherbaspirillum cavernae]